jgi:hypothetical protein
MRWFRSNRRGAAWLAVFALVCQLGLSFGHVHLGRLTADVWAGGESNGDIPPARPQSQQRDSSLPRSFCAICANIALAGSLVFPAAPKILVPIPLTQTLVWAQAATEIVSLERLTFNARAPPQA